MILDAALVLQLATACAPAVAPETIAAIARTESGFDPLSIGDNTTRRAYAPASRDDAVALASSLLQQGHSVDLGLMQINSANLPGLGLSIGDALDTCKSIAAGGRILAAAFAGGGATPDEAQAALRVALSRYNTGNGQDGFINGYVRKVEASARYLVPALQVSTAPDSTTQAPALPLRTPASTRSPVAAEGEWHAGTSFGTPSLNSDGEWHASSPGAAAPKPITPSAPPGPASIVLLQGQPGSKP